MPVTRRACAFLVVLFLLLGQQAALLHAVSHFVKATGHGAEPQVSTPRGPNAPAPDGEPCPECLAYSQIAAFVATAIGAPVVAAGQSDSPLPPPKPGWQSFPLFAFLARAPPVLL